MHSERQVTYLNETKKVILFLVEGVTDETILGLLLSKLMEEDKVVRFKIVGGDITTRNGTNAKNCINRVVDQIKEFLAQDIYQKNDILEVVHLVDMDGAFIPDDHVVKATKQLPKGTHIYYTTDQIITDNVEGVLNRNHQKAEVLEKLSVTKELYGKIPYQVYFFSCNVEHVFYDCQNALDQQKYEMAKQIEDQFVENPSEFIKFLNSGDIPVSDEYNESWNLLKREEESLKRHSNFHLYMNSYQKQT